MNVNAMMIKIWRQHHNALLLSELLLHFKTNFLWTYWASDTEIKREKSSPCIPWFCVRVRNIVFRRSISLNDSRNVVMRPLHGPESNKYFSSCLLYIEQQKISTLPREKYIASYLQGTHLKKYFPKMCVQPQREGDRVSRGARKGIKTLHLQIVHLRRWEHQRHRLLA